MGAPSSQTPLHCCGLLPSTQPVALSHAWCTVTLGHEHRLFSLTGAPCPQISRWLTPHFLHVLVQTSPFNETYSDSDSLI